MTEIFYQKIQTSLSNPSLQEALDGNADRRAKARSEAYKSLPEDLQTMRARSHSVRAETIANLDQYLDQFTQQASNNGIIVHWAQDSAEARQVVLDIARDNHVRLVAKSKTMVGEEIEINSALEDAGIQAVETDLGEYIVQLRGEPPAHIITPAVHLRRGDVAATLQEKLGIPYDEDIPAMTETARQVLRETFMKADLGISGVNFGVAESGSMCIVTNEGNARMITTLPPVHIALMGIERLVPSMDDLALMLYLLPRSATGQKLTVYTTLINSPRRSGESDGSQERHLILVDNGRTAIRQSSLAEILHCIRCGACINACPVFREIGGHAYVGTRGQNTPYPGPIGSVVSPGLFGQPEFGQLARATSLCGACKEACPVDIDLPKLLLRVRAGGLPAHPSQASDLRSLADGETPSLKPLTLAPQGLQRGLRLYTWFATSPRRFAAVQRLAGIAGRIAAPFSDWMRLPAFTGWGYNRDFPRPAVKPFRQRFTEVSKDAKFAESSARDKATHLLSPITNNSHASTISSVGTTASSTLSPIQRFDEELSSLGGSFVVCSESELLKHLLALLQERSLNSILAWAEDTLPTGLVQEMRDAGIQVSHEPDTAITTGLTGALAGIAETGTLVIPAGAGRTIMPSLTTEIHIAILNAGDIKENLPQALNLPEVSAASSTVLVSGPSRTADIEMTLTIGVHGPREVHVFCITD